MEQKLDKMLLDVAQAVLDNCLELAARGRSLDTVNLDEVISSVIGKDAKGVVIDEDLVSSLVGLVSEIDMHGNVEPEVNQAGIEAPYNKSQALLHKAGYDWPGKDVERCEKFLVALTEQSLGQAISIARGKADISMADASGINGKKTYHGPVMGVTDERLHVVQSVGPVAVIHEAKNLNGMPEKDKMIRVEYDGKGPGIVTDVGKEKSKGVER